MAVVTIDAASIAADGSGITGWSAKSTFAIPRVLNESTPTNFFQNMGDVAGNTRVGNSFLPGTTTTISEVWMDLRKQGSPTDNLFVDIYTDSSNTPGTLLGTSEAVLGSILDITVHTPFRFFFTTPVAVTSATKYWIVFRRSGANNGSNYYQIAASSSNPTSNSGTSLYNASWGAENTSNDMGYSIRSSLFDLYQLTQDTKIHIWKSTDNAASWSEVDAGNGPTVNSSTKPFSGDYLYVANSTTGVIERNIGVVYFSGTNTARVRYFSLTSNTWSGTDVGAADAATNVDFLRNIRLTLSWSDQVIYYTSFIDDADLNYSRRTTSTWGAATAVLATVSSTEASAFADVIKNRQYFNTAYYYDVFSDDFSVRTLISATLGTETDVDATIATTEVGHTSANYDPYYVSGTQNALIAFIDADDSLDVRTHALEVTSASITQGTQAQVTASTSYAGRQLATCKFGSDFYVFASIGTGIDYFVDTAADGTWGSVVNWKSGLTNGYLNSAIALAGVGILVTYTDNGDVKSDILIPPVYENLAASVSAQGDITGALSKIRAEMVASISATGSITGQLDARKEIAGSISAAGNTTGQLDARKEIAGSISAASDITGTISKIRAELVGSISASSSLTGHIEVRKELTASISGTGTLTGHIDARKELAGSISATGSTTVELSNRRELAASISAASNITGTISKIRAELVASVSATGSITGHIEVRKELQTSISATGSITAHLDARVELAGSISTTGSLTGHIEARKELRTTVSAASNITGDLRKVRAELVSTISASGTIAAHLDVRKELQTTVSAASTTLGHIETRKELRTTVSATSNTVVAISRAMKLSGSLSAEGSAFIRYQQILGSLIKIAINEPYSLVKLESLTPFDVTQSALAEPILLTKETSDEPYSAEQSDTDFVDFSLTKISPSFSRRQLIIS